MWYQAGADAVLLIHFGFILFVLLGGFLAWKWAWVPWLHLPAALWGALIEFSGGICPLTPLENRLRQAAGGDGIEVVVDLGVAQQHDRTLAELLLDL